MWTGRRVRKQGAYLLFETPEQRMLEFAGSPIGKLSFHVDHVMEQTLCKAMPPDHFLRLTHSLFRQTIVTPSDLHKALAK